MIKKISIEEINKRIKSDVTGFIEECDSDFKKVTQAAAEKILADSEKCPVVLLTGPSGSGKTTTSKLIERILDTSGHETHTVSMDNYYYRPDGEMPKDERGDIDYESPLLLDAELLRTQLSQLNACEPVYFPTYDFVTCTRTFANEPLIRKKGEIVILEGIHALNPDIMGNVLSFAQTIYISPRTYIDFNDTLMHPSYVRLLRRMLRDSRTRGRDIKETAEKMWSVTRGERLYINPNKQNAKIEINTLIPYELPVYASLLTDALRNAKEMPEEVNISGLLELLEAIKPIELEQIKKDALIREFTGGGIW